MIRLPNPSLGPRTPVLAKRPCAVFCPPVCTPGGSISELGAGHGQVLSLEVQLGLSLFFEDPESPSCLCQSHLVTETASHKLKICSSRVSILVVKPQGEPSPNWTSAGPAWTQPS